VRGFHKGTLCFVGAILLAQLSAATIAKASRGSAPWPSAKFVAENHCQCPALDLTMLTDGTLTDETDRAFADLSPRRRAVLDARIRRRCASEWGGFYCENQVTIQGLDRWGLTPAFVSHLCRQYRRCTLDPAAC
jgi:hypothetical protein